MGPAHLLHLARRFFGSLWPRGPAAADERWAQSQLLPGEVDLWIEMSGADRRHAVGVARRTVVELGADAADRSVLAAALLHDVGKIESALGPVSRAIATVVGWFAGRERAESWSRRPRGLRSRFGRYLCHDRLGAQLLEDAGSDDVTVSWARDHHLPPDRWHAPTRVGQALKAADDD